MSAEVAEKIATVLNEYQWNQPADYPSIWKMSAHGGHQYHGDCGICRGDVNAIAAVIADLFTAPNKAATS